MTAAVIPFPPQGPMAAAEPSLEPAAPVPPAVAVELRDMARDLYQDAKAAVWPKISEWSRNYAFNKGHQWGSVDFLEDATDEERETYNLIRTFVRTYVANLLAYLPNPEVLAPSSDPTALEKARAAHRLVRGWLRSDILSFEELDRAALNSAMFGMSWLKTYWNPRKGREKREWMWVQDPNTGVWTAAVDRLNQQKIRSTFEGEIDFDACDPFSVFPDPSATKYKNLGYVVELDQMPLWRAEQDYSADYLGNRTKGRWKLSSGTFDEYSPKILQPGMFGTQIPGSRSDRNRIVDVCRLYMLPTDEFQEGLYLCWSEDLILAIGPSPTFPWSVLLGPNRDGMSFYPAGLTNDLVQPQQTLNLQMTKIREHVVASAPGIIAPYGSNFAESDMSNIEGWFAQYNMGYKPEAFENTRLNPEAFTTKDTIVDMMKFLASISDASMGNFPNASGVALDLMHELDSRVRNPEVQHMRLAIKSVLQKMLRLGKMYYPEGRLTHLYGEDNKWLAIPLKRDDIAWDSDVIVEPMSTQPASKALVDEQILRGVQYKIFDGSPGNERALAMLKLQTDDKTAYGESESAESEALRENDSWRRLGISAQLEVVLAEDHMTHRHVHDRERASPYYKAQPPEVRNVLDMHVQFHEMAMLYQQQHMAMQAAQMQAAQGIGPSGGAPLGAVDPAAMQQGYGVPGPEAPAGGEAPAGPASPEPPTSPAP